MINKDKIEGNWDKLKGKIKERWGKLTDDEIVKSEGRMDELAGKIQERYGDSRENAKKQLEELKKAV